MAMTEARDYDYNSNLLSFSSDCSRSHGRSIQWETPTSVARVKYDIYISHQPKQRSTNDQI